MNNHSQSTSVKLYGSRCQYTWIICGQYSRSSIRTCTHIQSGCKAFREICCSVVKPRCSTVLFSDIGLQERLASLSVRVLLVPVENGNHLPTHNYRSCVGEVERLKLKLKDLGSRLTQCFRYYVRSPNHLHRFPGFLGMGTHAQAVDTRPLSLLTRGLGMRLI